MKRRFFRVRSASPSASLRGFNIPSICYSRQPTDALGYQ
jgi:hypothetical protein